MQELFGIPMDTIMLVLVVLFVISLLSVSLIFLMNRTMFRMGLRNIPRRGLQTGLVVVGLMLATLITTAAFTTGDTIDYSIARAGYDSLQRTDLALNLLGEDTAPGTDLAVYFNDGTPAGLERQFQNDPDIEGYIPLLLEAVPAVNTRTKQSEPSITLSGIDPQRQEKVGGLRLTSGGKADLSRLGANDIFLSKRAAEKLDAKVDDTLTLYVNGSQTDIKVIGVVEDEIASSGVTAFFMQGSGGGAMLLSSVQRLTNHAGQINQLGVALKGTVEGSYVRSDAAISRLEPYLQSDQGKALLGVDNPVSVEPVKADTIEEAELSGNLFTTFFLVIGLFSIAAGVMLIFMIFVMLAAERKAEMGIARAVGAQRSNLIQSFISEGMAYSIMAGAVGAAVGVAASLALVSGFMKVIGGFDFIQAHITVRSLVVSYCLGVVLTFITVVISSIKVSSVNIVAAIRGSDDDESRERRKKISWLWVILGIPTLIIPPLGIWLVFRKGFGIPWTWIMGPLGIVLGFIAILVASGNGSQFLFSFGVSVLPLCIAMLASNYKAPGRLTWTLVGVYLALYWLAPVDYGKLLLGKELSGDIEMFFLSGVMVVISFTLIIVFNANLLTALFQRDSGGNRYMVPAILFGLTILSFITALALGDASNGLGELMYLFGGVIAIAALTALASVLFPQIAPALKMGVAYPLSNRFRTGMTIAMFSLIVFSLATFSAINATFVSLLTAEGGDGGWDVLVSANRNTNAEDVQGLLRSANAEVANDIETVGRTTIFTGQSQVRARIPGAPEETDFSTYPVLGADNAFLSMPDSTLTAWARGYDDEQDVFSAVANGNNLALVDVSVLPNEFNEFEYNLGDLSVEDDRFEPFQMDLRDVATGRSTTVTVVGVLGTRVPTLYTSGVYVPERIYTQIYGDPEYLRSYVKLNHGVSAGRAANEIEAALVTQGMQAESIRTLLDEAVAQQNSFIRMFQGFMALGLFTGIAALGVIAYRSVVERRQQIGMLRAIGYQTGTVAMSFMFESGFIALMGIMSGVIGGMIIARNLFVTDEFGQETIQFAIPWIEILLMSGAAFVASMFMTWWPSRQAARVPVAEALRYE